MNRLGAIAGSCEMQFPRFRQVIHQARTKNGIELSIAGKVGLLQIRLREFRIFDVQEFLDESGLAQIYLAAFQSEHAFYARPLRQDEGVRAFQRAELQNRRRLGREAKELLDPGVADRADSAAIVRAVDPELENPWGQFRELRC